MDFNPSENDHSIIREIAKKYAAIAAKDEMTVRKRQWKALHDLKPERPMFIFEPYWVDGFLREEDIKCENELLRNVEKKMMFSIKQYEVIGDDVVLEPYFRIAWWGEGLTSTGKKFGDIEIVEHGAKDASLAYLSNFPIQKPDDIKRLEHREFHIDREPSLKMKEMLENIFGDIVPVKLGNFDNFDFDLGNQPFTGNNFIGVTWDLFKLIGAESMMMWMFDYPNALHELCRFLVDEKKAFFNFLLKEKLLEFNTDNQFAGPSCYGYVSDLPEYGTDKEVEFKDLWAWPESQESESISPAMFNEFYLPYIAEMANMFGLSYYACCEKIHDRFEYITDAIHNIRNFSVSGWSDFYKAAELLGNKYVYSRKPVPAYVSDVNADWDMVKKGAQQTAKATKDNNCCVEVILRDAYSANCTPERAKEWVRVWKEAMGVG